MAKFRIFVLHATFIRAGHRVLIRKTMMPFSLANEEVDCKTCDELKSRIAELAEKVKLTMPDQSFYTHHYLIEGRAPAGYCDTHFGLDHDAGNNSAS